MKASCGQAKAVVFHSCLRLDEMIDSMGKLVSVFPAREKSYRGSFVQIQQKI